MLYGGQSKGLQGLISEVLAIPALSIRGHRLKAQCLRCFARQPKQAIQRFEHYLNPPAKAINFQRAEGRHRMVDDHDMQRISSGENFRQVQRSVPGSNNGKVWPRQRTVSAQRQVSPHPPGRSCRVSTTASNGIPKGLATGFHIQHLGQKHGEGQVETDARALRLGAESMVDPATQPV